MANVKFNRGTIDQAGSNTADALAFLAKGTGGTPTTAGNYGYLYLGTQMVATKYLDQMDLSGFDTSRGLLEISGSTAALTVHTIASTYTEGTTTWSSATTDIPTAGAITSYVAEQIGANDKYHTTGTWDSTNWNVYTATSVHNAGELSITLPIADGTNYSTDNTHLTTPKQVADFVAGLAGGMRYAGSISSATLPTGEGTIAPYKSGDVFIASTTFTVGTSPNQRTIEEGDMVVLNSNYTSGNLAYADNKWNFDQFERDVTGTVTKSADMTQYGVAYATGSSTITSTTAGAVGSILIGQGSAAPTWLAKGTTGQVLKAGSDTIAWADNYYEMVAAVSGNANQITVTPYTNGTAGTATTITINDVEHATNADKVNQTAKTTGSSPILVSGAATPTSGDPEDVDYVSRINANAATGEITVTYNSGAQGESDQTVNIVDTLLWHTLS